MKTTDFQVYVPVDEGFLRHPATGRDVPHPGDYEWFQMEWERWSSAAEDAAIGFWDNMQAYPVVHD